MGLKESISDKKFDVRLRDKRIEDGRISKEEVKEYLESLPDEGPKAQFNVYEGNRRKTVYLPSHESID